MEVEQVTMAEIMKKLEKMETMIDRKERRQIRERKSSTSFSQNDSDVEDFYERRHEGKERRHQKSNEGKIFKHNAWFLKFMGDSNLNVYEKWERKVEQFKYSCKFSDEEVLKLVVLEFEDYALFWWHKYQSQIAGGKKHQILLGWI